MTLRLQNAGAIRMLGLGDFAAAESALGGDWHGHGVEPSPDGHDDHSYAELLMLCGVLTVERGLMGSVLQERGKNMLHKSMRLYGDNAEGAQAAKCWLATAYERSGEFNEALTVADSVLSEHPNLDVVVCATKVKAISQTGLGFPEEALRTLAEIEPLVNATAPLIQGKYYLQRGIVHRKLQMLENAIEDYRLASDKFQEAGSARYEAAASNNMAGVCMDSGDYKTAHRLVERSIMLFHRIQDSNHEGMAWDQKGQIYLREKKPYDAERAAGNAVGLLESGDHTDFLAEALTTHGKALIAVAELSNQKYKDGLNQIRKAVRLYERQNNPKLAADTHRLLLKSFERTKTASEAIAESSRGAEHDIIEHLLAINEGGINKPAAALGLSHRGLDERIRRLHPDLIPKRKAPRKRRRSILKHS